MFSRLLVLILELISPHAEEDVNVKNLTLRYTDRVTHTQEPDDINGKASLFSDMWVFWETDIDGKGCSIAERRNISLAVKFDLVQTK